MHGATACPCSCSARPGRGTRRSAGPGSTGSTPRPTKARSSATTPSGTTSQPRCPRLTRRSCAQRRSPTPRRAAFPSDHPLHAAPPATFLSPDAAKLLRETDVVLALDWIDLAGVLKQAWGAEPVGAKVIQVSPDAHLHRGWSMDYQGLPPVDLYMMCEPEAAVPLLLDAVKARPAALVSKPAPLPDPAPDGVSIRTLA